MIAEQNNVTYAEVASLVISKGNYAHLGPLVAHPWAHTETLDANHDTLTLGKQLFDLSEEYLIADDFHCGYAGYSLRPKTVL